MEQYCLTEGKKGPANINHTCRFSPALSLSIRQGLREERKGKGEEGGGARKGKGVGEGLGLVCEERGGVGRAEGGGVGGEGVLKPLLRIRWVKTLREVSVSEV